LDKKRDKQKYESGPLIQNNRTPALIMLSYGRRVTLSLPFRKSCGLFFDLVKRLLPSVGIAASENSNSV
jgi:hypothetical protein